jgi:hypothetical protein
MAKKEITYSLPQEVANLTVTITDGNITFTSTIEQFVQKNKGGALGFVREAAKTDTGTFTQGVNIYMGKAGSSKTNWTENLTDAQKEKFSILRRKIKAAVAGGINCRLLKYEDELDTSLEALLTAHKVTDRAIARALRGSIRDEFNKELEVRSEPDEVEDEDGDISDSDEDLGQIPEPQA